MSLARNEWKNLEINRYTPLLMHSCTCPMSLPMLNVSLQLASLHLDRSRVQGNLCKKKYFMLSVFDVKLLHHYLTGKDSQDI